MFPGKIWINACLPQLQLKTDQSNDPPKSNFVNWWVLGITHKRMVGALLTHVEMTQGRHVTESLEAHVCLGDEPQNLNPWRSPKSSQAARLVPGSPLLSSCFYLCNLGEEPGKSSKFLLSPFSFVLSLSLLSNSPSLYVCVCGGECISIWKKLLHNKKNRGVMPRSVFVSGIEKTFLGYHWVERES